MRLDHLLSMEYSSDFKATLFQVEASSSALSSFEGTPLRQFFENYTEETKCIKIIVFHYEDSVSRMV